MNWISRRAYPEGQGRHRYWLETIWDANLPLLVACMLNPSDASDQETDPTIDRRLEGFAKSWDYGGSHVVNLFAFRSRNPTPMFAADDRIGVHNDAHLKAAIAKAQHNGGKLFVGWGNDGNWLDNRADQFIAMVAENNQVQLICLGITKLGNPYHPSPKTRKYAPDGSAWKLFRS